MQLLFTHDRSDKLQEQLENERIPLHKLPYLLHHPSFHQLLIPLLKKDVTYAYQIAVILSHLDLRTVDPIIKTHLSFTTTTDRSLIRIAYQNWYLCSSTENYLEESIHSSAAVLLNDHLLLKLRGKPAALCLNTFTSMAGYTFFKGVWYSPTDASTGKAIRDCFLSESMTPNIHQAGSWTIMRPLRNSESATASQLLELSRAYSQNLPVTVPTTINGVPKKKYLYSQDISQNVVMPHL